MTRVIAAGSGRCQTPATVNYPKIIQGGMGVAVSAWPLANAVSSRGQLGVVSGTGLDAVLARRLQLGDVGGHLAAAFEQFPVKEMAARVWERYFVPGGKAPGAAFKSRPLFSISPTKALLELTVVANFVEVWLAKRGHDGQVGINLLEKIQLPTIPSLYGAMLAGVDYVLMGAGIPRAIPGILDRLAAGESAELRIDVAGGDSAVAPFDPTPFGACTLKRPQFLAIVSSASLAQLLATKCHPPVDGFVVEGPTAGGHNAPPRGALQLNERGEPLYGERDLPDFAKFRDLGKPFWLAGSYGTRMRLEDALAVGAQGIQVGTAFAFCDESGIQPEIKADVLMRSVAGRAEVFTDPKASPTGFPFKVVQLPGSMADPEVLAKRERVCDAGYLREAYRKEDGSLGYRCASEPEDDFERKGGDVALTEGRLCVCNGLLATVGLGQVRKGVEEPVLVTAGDEVASIARYLKPGRTSYGAADVLEVLLA